MKRQMISMTLIFSFIGIIISACGLDYSFGPTATPTHPPDPATVLESMGFEEITFLETCPTCKHYDYQQQWISVEYYENSFFIRLSRDPSLSIDPVQQTIMLNEILITLYPADLVKDIMTAVNTPCSNLSCRNDGTIETHSWVVFVNSNPVSTKHNKVEVQIFPPE